MRRWVRENMPEVRRLISYQDARHQGTIYKADNWRLVYAARPGRASWSNRPGRQRTERPLKSKWERNP